MKYSLLVLSLFVASFAKAENPNVLLICIDDLRPELACYGVDYIKSPHIDKLASEGRLFGSHYVQAPTCGASRYTLLTGTYGPSGNGALFARAKNVKQDPKSVTPSMPAWFRQNGYQTVSIGKVSHHPGGWGGKDWDDKADVEMPNSWDHSLMPVGPWKHPRGAMHGLANGEIRVKAGDMALYQTFDGGDEVYPDGLIVDGALKEIDRLAKAKAKFFLAVGIIRPHLPFGAPAKYLEPYKDAKLPETPHPKKPEGKTTWHRSGEFMKYKRWGKNPNTDAEFALEVRRHYAACVTYADAQVGRLVEQLKKQGLYDNTIIVVWGDHGWHLGEHSIWGKHALFEESLRSPLIIRQPKSPSPGKRSDSIVESIDIYPTLCELAGLEIPKSLDGTSLLPQIKDAVAKGRTAVGYHRGASTIRTKTHRLIAHKGYHELYDHSSKEGETKNIAEAHPEVVSELAALLKKRLGKE